MRKHVNFVCCWNWNSKFYEKKINITIDNPNQKFLQFKNSLKLKNLSFEKKFLNLFHLRKKFQI